MVHKYNPLQSRLKESILLWTIKKFEAWAKVETFNNTYTRGGGDIKV
jgi:hypothetical protein